jgi:hypothetical protein
MLDTLVVRPGSAASLERRDPRDTLGLPGRPTALDRLAALLEELSSLPERLYAEVWRRRPQRIVEFERLLSAGTARPAIPGA